MLITPQAYVNEELCVSLPEVGRMIPFSKWELSSSPGGIADFCPNTQLWEKEFWGVPDIDKWGLLCIRG